MTAIQFPQYFAKVIPLYSSCLVLRFGDARDVLPLRIFLQISVASAVSLIGALNMRHMKSRYHIIYTTSREYNKHLRKPMDIYMLDCVFVFLTRVVVVVGFTLEL